MSSANTDQTNAAADQVERIVRPWGWHAGDGTGPQRVAHNRTEEHDHE